MHADELADLLRWCAALSTDPADLAGAVHGCRGPALVGAGRLAGGLARAHSADLPARQRKRRIWLSETGMERVPEELRAVVAAYDQLPKLQRAVLMLSYLEGITNAEIAGIVDRSAARVRLELDRGLAAIGGDPYSVRAALDIASWHLPAPAEVTRAFQRHARTRARRRRRIGLAGVAVGTLAAVLLTVSAVHRPYVEPRQAGVWTFSHTVRTLPGWSVQSRTVEREWETTTLRADSPEKRQVLRRGRRLGCHVGTTAAASPDKGSGWHSLALSTQSASGRTVAGRCCGGSTPTPPW